jgi:hypothetical protein
VGRLTAYPNCITKCITQNPKSGRLTGNLGTPPAMFLYFLFKGKKK